MFSLCECVCVYVCVVFSAQGVTFDAIDMKLGGTSQKYLGQIGVSRSLGQGQVMESTNCMSKLLIRSRSESGLK